MSKPSCVNLKERFGRRFKVRHEESYLAENLKYRSTEEVWLQIIPCIGGEVYPHGGDKLAAFLRAGPRAERLKRLPCVQVKTAGSDGVTVIFDVADFARVAEIMQPRKRAQPQLSQEQRDARREAMKRVNAQRWQTHPGPQESTIGV